MFFNKKINSEGVTLMETIVALGILTVGVTAALSLALGSISFSQKSEQTIVVVNLARENIEMVRSIRDLNGFNAVTAGTYVVNVGSGGGSLELYTADSSTDIADCENCSLELYEGRYLHDVLGSLTGDQTIFKRWVKISKIGEYERKILSEVYWTERGQERTFLLETYITDW